MSTVFISFQSPAPVSPTFSQIHEPFNYYYLYIHLYININCIRVVHMLVCLGLTTWD